MRRLSGFSLMEMMTTLLIISIVAAAAAPMINKKMTVSNVNGCPWAKLGNGSIAYNINSANISAIIGDDETGNNLNSRLHITSQLDNPFITFKHNDNDNVLSLRHRGDTLSLSSGQSQSGSTVYGSSALGFATDSVVIGNDAEVRGFGAIAIGSSANSADNATKAEGSYSVSVGVGTYSGGTSSVAIGRIAKANATSAIAIGTDSLCSGSNSIAIGLNANTEKGDAITIGTRAYAKYAQDIAIGLDVTADAGSSIAIGSPAYISGKGERYTRATGNGGSIALGDGTIANGGGAVALGKGSDAIGNNSVALGALATATNSSAIAIGYNSKATTTNSVAIGNGAKANKNNQIVLGTSSSTVYIPGNLVVGGSTYLSADKTPEGAGNRFNVYMRMGTGQMARIHEDPGTANELYHDYSNHTVPYSDRRLKNVGKEFKAGLAELKKLDLFHYTYKKDKSKTPHVGVIAQDLEKVFPDAITKDEKGFLRIRLEDMFYSLINAVKELARMFDKQDERIVQLEKENKQLTKTIDDLEKQNHEILKRLEKLEKQK